MNPAARPVNQRNSLRHNGDMPGANYVELERILSAARALTGLAEAHGTLAGALCAAPAYALDDWLGEILPEGHADAATREHCRTLFESTEGELSGAEMAFTVLLPDDAVPIDERARALGAWCQGFLYGLGTSAIEDVTRLPGEVGEIVRDFVELTRIGIDAGESAETNEEAYAELVEFVRVGVQLLFEELAPFRTPPLATGESLH
jgi:hypothetical protein